MASDTATAPPQDGVAASVRAIAGADPPQETASVAQTVRDLAGGSDVASQVRALAVAPDEPQKGEEPSLWDAAGAFVDNFFGRVLGQPEGGFGANQALIDAQPGAKITDFAAILFPGVSGRRPTHEEMSNLAQSNPEFGKVWGALKGAQKRSQDLATELYGEKPDWGQVQQQYIAGRVRELGLPAEETGGPAYLLPPLQLRSTPPGVAPLPSSVHLPSQRKEPIETPVAMKMTARDQALAGYAEEADTGPPGYTRPPLSDEEITKSAYSMLKAKSAADIAALPTWARGISGGLAEGVKLAPLLVAGPAGLIAGGVFETSQQALQLASGARKGFDPGEILLSSLLFKGAGAVGKLASVAGKGAEAAAQIGTFEAASGARAIISGAHDEDQRSTWQKFSEHVIESATAMLTGGALVGGLAPEGTKARNLPPDYTATAATGKILEDNIRAALHMREGGEPTRITERRHQIEEEVAPIEAKIAEKQDQINAVTKKLAGGDKKLATDIETTARIAVESEGGLVLPKDVIAPKDLDTVVGMVQDIGAANLEISRVMTKYGLVPEARYELPDGNTRIVMSSGETTDLAPDGTVIKEVPGRIPLPNGSKLVGAHAFHEQQGFYFPRSDAEGAKEMPAPARMQPSQLGQGPLKESLRGHLSKRQQSFDEAFLSRPLDLTMSTSYGVMLEALNGIRGKAWLDLSRADGDMRTTEELPDTLAKQQAKQRVEELRKAIRGLKKSLPLEGDVTKQLEVLKQIGDHTKDIGELQAAMKDQLYRQIPATPQWPKEYHGMWLHRDAFAQFKAINPQHSGIVEFARELRSIAKITKTGFSWRQWVPDFIGNVFQYAEAGMNAIRGIGHAWKVAVKGQSKDSLDRIFDVYARRASLGGTTDVTTADVARLSSINRRIDEATRAGEHAVGLRLTRILRKRGELLTLLNDGVNRLPLVARLPLRIPQGLINAFLKTPRGRQAVVDHAQARTAFRNMAMYGIGDSGPMKPSEAFDQLRGTADYSTLPASVQTTAVLTDFVRWRAKYAQSTVTRTMMRRPSVLGIPIPTPLDFVIRAAPGSPAAQTALVARGMLRLATSGAQYLVPLALLQRALAHHQGISQDELRKQLNDKFDYLPGPVAWLSKMTYLTTGKDKFGGITGVDAAGYIPAMATMRYFLSSSKQAPLWWQALHKNLLLGGASQVIAGRDYAHNPVSEGFGPHQRFWPIIGTFMPDAILGPLEAYFREKEAPPAERDAIHAAMRTILGVNVQRLPNLMWMDREVQRYVEAGVIGVEQRDNGSWNYYVKRPDTIEGMNAKTVLDGAKKYNVDLFRQDRILYHKMQSDLEKAGLR